MTYDAFSRTKTATSPDVSVVRYSYDEGGALARVELDHRDGGSFADVVSSVTYNEKGQRRAGAWGLVGGHPQGAWIAA